MSSRNNSLSKTSRNRSPLAATAPVLEALRRLVRRIPDPRPTSPAGPGCVLEPLEGRRLLTVVTTTEVYPWAVEEFGKDGGNNADGGKGGVVTAAPAGGDNGDAPLTDAFSGNSGNSGNSGHGTQYDQFMTPNPFMCVGPFGDAPGKQAVQGSAAREVRAMPSNPWGIDMSAIPRPGGRPETKRIALAEDPGTTGDPIRYFNGQPIISAIDLVSDSFGMRWGQTRSWSDASRSDNPNYLEQQAVNGEGWATSEMPQLVRPVSVAPGTPNGTYQTVVAVNNGVEQRFFDQAGLGGSWQARGWRSDTLTEGNGEYVLTDSTGTTIRYYNFYNADPLLRGQFKSVTDRAGNVTSATYSGPGDSDGVPQGRLKAVTRSNTSGDSETWKYAYVDTGVNAGRLKTVQLLHGASAAPDRQVEYTYWDGSTSGGKTGMLQKAEVRDGAGNAIEASFYRYYAEDTAPTDEFAGYEGALKMVFGPESYARVIADGNDPVTASDADLRPYANNFFGYHLATSANDKHDRFVNREVAQGAGCSCGASGGRGAYALEYFDNTDSSVSIANRDYNAWIRRTTVTLPDGNEEVAYTNFAGQVMLSMFTDTATNQQWRTSYQYDGKGRLLVKAEPSAVTTHYEGSPDLVNSPASPGGNAEAIADNTGLVHTFQFGNSTTATATAAGDADGYLKRESLGNGELGTLVPQHDYAYIERVGSATTTYPIALSTIYRNTGASGAEATTYSYTWHGTSNQPASVAVAAPVVTGSQNGPGVAETAKVYSDEYGPPHLDGRRRGLPHLPSLR